MRGPLLLRKPLHIAVDCAAILIVLACATVAFQPVFGGTQYLWAGLGGAVLGVVVGVVTSIGPLRGWMQTVAGAIIVFTLFGPALAVRDGTFAGFIPTPGGLRELYLGVVFSWRRLLTAQPPAEGFPGPLIVPLIVMLVCATVATVLAMRLRRGAPWAMLPGVVALVVGIAFGTKVSVWPIALGVVVAAVAVLWVSWRLGQWRVSLAEEVEVTNDTRQRGTARRRRVLGGLAMVAGAAVVGSLVMLPIQPTNRHVIRDVVEPPVEIEEFPSPLAGYRGWIKDFEDETLLVVSGVTGDARIPVATLDYYDSTVYAVAGTQDGAVSGEFTRVGDSIQTDQSGEQVTMQVDVGDYEAVWVPTIGYATSIDFSGPRGDDLQGSLSYNATTGTAIAVDGLAPGDEYTVDAIVPSTPPLADLRDVPFSDVQMPEPAVVPDQIQAWVSTYGRGAESPVENIEALVTQLQLGAFSHGLEGDPTSLAGHGVYRMDSMFAADTTVGDDEQYAAALALALSYMDIPARVVMGFHMGDEGFGDDGAATELTGGDMHAWVEVPFQGVGWVPIDPSPPEDQDEVDPPPVPEPNPKPQVLQPPQPPEEPAELTPGTQPEPGQDDDDDDAANLWWILRIAGIVLGILAILALPFIVIGLLKSRRRRRRFERDDQAARLAGGWQEVVDHAVDLGLAVPVGVTRREVAGVVHERYPESRANPIGEYVDAGVFGPAPPPEDEVTAFWGDVDASVARMRKDATRRQRLVSRLSLRSFLRRRKGRA